MTEKISNKPRHIAIIMDGNGRWAKSKGLPRVAGHKAGATSLKNIVRATGEIGIDYLTVYAFSTENWKRPADEVGALFKLLVEYCKSQVKELIENNTKVVFIGDIEAMPELEKRAMREAERATAACTGLQFNICINYGSRQEIIQAIKKILSSGIEVESIDENIVNKYLYTCDIPDPDLIIRTSGEERLSNFMLWQSSYSEFIFVDQYWPDFNREILEQCLLIYQKRKRRYGSV